MRTKYFLYLLILFTTFINATVYEDAEDRTTDGWSLYDNTPDGATITNVYNRGGRVIELDGDSRKNGYILGSISEESKKWHDTQNDSVAWRMRFNENFVVFISVETISGHRYVTYTSKKGYHYIDGEYIVLSLNGQPINNSWVSFIRNIKDDIHEFEPENELLSIDAFMVRGSGLIDDIETKNLTNTISHIYDIGGNTGAWKIYDNTPSGASVTSVEAIFSGYTDEYQIPTHHTKLNGSGRNNGYMLGNIKGSGRWNNTTDSIVTWRMRFEDNFVVFVYVKTELGDRYLTYTSKKGYHQQSGNYLILSLENPIDDNDWVDFSRDIEDDLHSFEPNNKLIALDAFLVRGSGLIDNVITYHKNHASLLLAEADRYNHAEIYSRNYAQLRTLEATDLVYLYSPNKPNGAIGFYLLNSDGSIDKKEAGYVVSNRWRSWYNVEEIQPVYNTTSNLLGVRPEDDDVPSDGSYLLERSRMGAFSHDIMWVWYDIRDLNNIQRVQGIVYESY